MKTRTHKATAHISAEPLEARIAPATFIVTNLNDAGAGSLRDAIGKANADATNDTIVFKAGTVGVLTLTTGALSVTSPVSIVGPGAGKLIISGGNVSRIFTVNDGNTGVDSPFSISGLALVDGNAGTTPGGAIHSLESLTVKNSVLVSNAAHIGGAVFMNSSALNKALITGSTISGNSASVGQGGGLYLDTGKGITILNSTVSGNTSNDGGGGAYLALDGDTTGKVKIVISNSFFRGNSTGGVGGGIAIDLNNQTVLISKTEISGNVSAGIGGGLYLDNGVLLMTGSLVAGNRVVGATNDGGGIYSLDSQTTLTGTRVTGNSASGDGGGILHNGVNDVTKFLKVVAGTISGNTAGERGGGIYGFQGGKVSIKGTSLLFNKAALFGGGISTIGSGSSSVGLEITGGVYEGNLGSRGGAVHTEGDGLVSIKSAKFLSNTTTSSDGGGVYLKTTSTASVVGSLFKGNSAASNGGAMVIAGTGAFTLTGVTAISNTAIASGGGLTVFSVGSVVMSKSLFKGNVADTVGGGVAMFTTTVDMKTTIITGNAAKTSSGGLHLVGVTATLAGTVKVFNNVAPVFPDKNI